MKRSKQRGVAAVELALIIGPMLIAVFGITELGRALYQYNALVKATRGAARYLAQQDLANLSTSDLTAVYNKTIELTVCGDTPCTGKEPLASGLSTAQVRLCDYLTCPITHMGVLTEKDGGSVDLVSVTIGGAGAQPYWFRSMVPAWVADLSFSPIKTTMTARYN